MKLRVTEPGEKPGVLDMKKNAEELKRTVENFRQTSGYMIEMMQISARVYRARYDALIAEGFKPEEALEIVKARGAEI